MMKDGTHLESYDKIAQEMRRGILVLATLSQLESKKYGYSLMSQLAENGLEIDQGTLYPLLRRLEKQGLLDSSWNTEGSRPRRYYQLNDSGRSVLAALTKDWHELAVVMKQLLLPPSEIET